MRNMSILLVALSIFAIITSSCNTSTPDFEVNKWEKLTLTFEGPNSSENAQQNPFTNFRLDVTFTNGTHSMTVPGFYAADGNAAETSGDAGNIWKAHFRPDKEGTWNYEAKLLSGENVYMENSTNSEPVEITHASGTIQVNAPKANAKGRLRYVGKRYQQFAESGDYFIKGGADSPENFLAYKDFDGTERFFPKEREGEATPDEELHKYSAHLKDWKTGDPTWKDGKGKEIVGALNYLASKGMNVVYFLSMNIEGDGKDVYPYTAYNERYRFDCSKLDQWEIVFDHMDELGLMQHFVTQETENEMLLDEGNTGPQRQLYYRELIARFGHHPQLTWNMGEENGPTDWSPNGQSIKQREDMINYFQQNDPYDNLVVIHSHSVKNHRDHMYEPHLGNKDLEGMSMQVSDRVNIHEVTKLWIDKSTAAGHPWVMNMDEIGKHWRGVDPDDREDNNQDTVRGHALWGNLMAGGAGTEWYFGYRNHNNDLKCEDWRSRDRMWDYTRYAMDFFHDHLPFIDMQSHDELINGEDIYCFASPGDIYAIYTMYGQATQLDLSASDKKYSLSWYNPRTGGALSNKSTVEGGQTIELIPPESNGEDWVALLKAS